MDEQEKPRLHLILLRLRRPVAWEQTYVRVPVTDRVMGPDGLDVEKFRAIGVVC